MKIFTLTPDRPRFAATTGIAPSHDTSNALVANFHLAGN